MSKTSRKSMELKKSNRLLIFVYLFVFLMVILASYGIIGVETIVALTIFWAMILAFAEKIRIN